jgi:hypothetical protein
VNSNKEMPWETVSVRLQIGKGLSLSHRLGLIVPFVGLGLGIRMLLGVVSAQQYPTCRPGEVAA